MLQAEIVRRTINCLLTPTPTPRNLDNHDNLPDGQPARRLYRRDDLRRKLSQSPRDQLEEIRRTTRAQLASILVSTRQTLNATKQWSEEVLRRTVGGEHFDESRSGTASSNREARSVRVEVIREERLALPPAPGAEPPNELEILEAEIVDDGPTPRDSGAPASGAALTPFLSSEDRDLDELLSGRYPSRTRQLLQDSRERELRRLREQGLNDLPPDVGSTERR